VTVTAALDWLDRLLLFAVVVTNVVVTTIALLRSSRH